MHSASRFPSCAIHALHDQVSKVANGSLISGFDSLKKTTIRLHSDNSNNLHSVDCYRNSTQCQSNLIIDF